MQGLTFVCLEPVCFSMQPEPKMPLHALLRVKVRMTVWGQAVGNQPGSRHHSQKLGSRGALEQPWASGTSLGTG